MAGSLPFLKALIARRYPRVEPLPNRPVEVQVMGAESLDVLRARDIGLGGVGVQVPHGFAGCDLAATVQLVIKLPRNKAFMARGTIRHANSSLNLFGIEFVDLDESAKAQISAYVAELSALGRVR